MEATVLGAGLMGIPITLDLANSPIIKKIKVIDKDKQKLEALTQKVKSPKIKVLCENVADEQNLKKIIKGSKVIISALPFYYNLSMTKLAIEVKSHFCDLGGNWEIVKKQMELDTEAKKAKVIIVPDCGLAPGITNIVVASALKKFKRIDTVKIFVGGLPQNPKPPLCYSLLFSVEGLINEYTQKCIILKNGEITEVDPLTGFEEIDFPPLFNRLEAWRTSGGSSTLPYTFKDNIKNLEYKTVRYPGHFRLIKGMIDMGMGEDKECKIAQTSTTFRQLFSGLLEQLLPHGGEDIVLMKVFAQKDDNMLTYEMQTYYDEETGLSAMQKTTGYMASIVAQMLAKGITNKAGVIPPELFANPDEFFEQLDKRGISIGKIIKKIQPQE